MEDIHEIFLGIMSYKMKTRKLKYPTNNFYFEQWSSNMAYILGYLMADGCVTDNGRLICQCKNDDIEILEFIRDELSPTRPISVKIVKHPTNDELLKVARLDFYNKILVQSLNKYNIISRKTFNEILPNIPQQFKSDYLRGLFDGDGCIFVGKYLDKKYNKYYQHQKIILASASKNFLISIKESLCNNYGYITFSGNCFQLVIGKKNLVEEIFHAMYDNAKIYLKRKYNKFIELGFSSCH